MNEQQHEFLFADGPSSELIPPDPLSEFLDEIAALWQVPIGQVAHVGLTSHDMSDLQGRIVLARAPNLPLDRRETLVLRIGTIEFTSRQIISWSLV